MNPAIPSLRPIKALETAEKARLPVSVALAEDGIEHIVSRYQDDVWDFWPYIRQENQTASGKRINWRVTFPDGSLLTDPQHTRLLESAKDLIWSLFNDPVEGRRRPMLLTVLGKFKSMTLLLRWMVNQGMTHFAQLDGRTMDYVPVVRLSEKGKAVVPQTAFMSLSILEDLYLQRDKLNDTLVLHPWPLESAAGLAGVKCRGRQEPKTARIPEPVVRQLACKALDYVEIRAAGLLDALDVLSAVEADATTAGMTGDAIRWQTAKAARQMGLTKSEFNKELTRLRTACYIVIDLFSGIRDSELLALSRNCIARGKGLDGVDLIWIHGSIFKTDDPAHKWLVPSVVEAAVRVMERYSEPYREALLAEGEMIERQLAEGGVDRRDRSWLVRRRDVVRHQADKLFLCRDPKTGSVQVLGGGSMSSQLKVFCRDLDILDGDGRPWPLAAHQFRRTYAYFVASAELGDLQYLREHFGHWSIDMTLLYADQATDEYEVDTDLLGEVLAAKNEKQEGVLRPYLLDDVPMANGDVMLADLRRMVCTAKNQDELIRQVAEGVVVNGTGHSWCIGNARGTGCGGLCVFEADMCVDCNYGIIGPEHLPVWKEIAAQQAAALRAPDLGKPGKARAKRILGKAREVIGKLEVSA